MPGRSFRICRIAGIPVGVSPWWLVIVALFTWTLGASYYPEVVTGIAPLASYGLGLASVLLLFLSILAHEFGHALVARRHGIEIEEIDLWLLGGVSRMRGEAHAPGDELRYAIAGPAVTAVIGACFGAAALLLPASTPKALLAIVEYEAFVNAAILVLNLMPAFPLDGGRVLRALLWRRSGRLGPATERAAAVGRGFGYLLIVLGLIELLNGFPEGLWFALIGFFIVMAAGQEVTGTQLREAMSGVRAADLMSRPALTIPLDCTVGEAAREFFARYRYTAYPVVDGDGRAVGMLDLRLLESEELHGHEDSPVGAVAGRDPDLLIAPDLDVVQLMERPAFARAGRAVVVDDAGFPQGLISITDVQRALWMERFAPDRPSARGAGGGHAMACMMGATVALLAGGAGAPGSARAAFSLPAPGWTEPATVSAAHDAVDSIALAAGPRGEMVLWHSDDLLPGGQVFGPPEAAFATASGEGPFGGERPLPSSFATGSLVNLGPMWGSGRVAQLTFRRTGQSTSEPAVALGGVDGRFAPPLPVHAAVWAGRASLAGDAQGDLLLAWISSTRSGRRQVWVSVRHSGHPFQAPRLVSATADAEQVTAAMGEGLHSMSAKGFDADMAVAFASRTGRMLVSVRLHGQGWGSVQDVGQAAVGTVNGVAVAFGRSSRVVVAWYRQQLSEGGPLGPGVTQVAVRPPDRHGFLPPQTLERDANASLTGTPSLVVNNGRGFLLAFVAQPGGLIHGFAPSIVRVSYSKGNRFAPPQTISPAGQQVSGVAAAEAPDGDVVTWSGGPNPPLTTLSPGAAIFAAVTYPPTGRLGAPVQVGPAEYAELATPIYAPYGQRWLLAWRGRQGTPAQSALGPVAVRVSSCVSQC